VTEELLELERLSFVPAAKRRIAGYGSEYADLDLDHALLVDRYEVTRGDWLRLAPEDLAEEVVTGWGPLDAASESLTWPATWMTFDEAQAFAELRGMRLPTAREWLFVAVGSSVTAYPWGPRGEESVSNSLGLGLKRLAAVGTFESGKAPTLGVYDLVGNAKEWVDGWVPSAEEDPPRDKNVLPPAPLMPPDAVSALGGSYLDRRRTTFGPGIKIQLVFNATSFAHEQRAADLGFRCVADAREYLWANAGRWGSDETARRRVVAVARRWSEAGGPLQLKRVLDELAARDGAPRGIGWLLEGTE